MLPTRPLGRTGLDVSLLGFGAGPLGDPELSDDDAHRLLSLACELGVTLVDTAPSYGRSEARIGAWIRSGGRVQVSTKLGYGVPGVPDWTGPVITAGIDQALERLGVEALDLAHLHSCPLHVLERGDVVEALVRGVEAGKVRVAAYSGEGDALSWAIASGAFGSVQASVSLCDPVAAGTVLADAAAGGLGVLAKRPLANAPWRGGAQPGSPEAIYQERWQALALEVEVAPAELLLRWAAFHPSVHAVLTGTVRPQHLRANVAALAAGPLPAEVQGAVEDSLRVATDWAGVI